MGDGPDPWLGLLASGAFTYRALAQGSATKEPAVRRWVRRARKRHAIFTVDHDNETLVPAFLLDADLAPRAELADVIGVLAQAGEDGWGLWTWLTSPTSWLGGAIPRDGLTGDP